MVGLNDPVEYEYEYEEEGDELPSMQYQEENPQLSDTQKNDRNQNRRQRDKLNVAVPNSRNGVNYE